MYGDAQDCSQLRVEYLATALAISTKRNSAIYVLNPQVITNDGEWEAWFFGDWLPGADRYRSFQDMMEAEYETFLELREDVRNLGDVPSKSEIDSEEHMSVDAGKSPESQNDTPKSEIEQATIGSTPRVEISQLRFVQPPSSRKLIIADQVNQILPRAINHGTPFTLEIRFRVMRLPSSLTESMLYRIQVQAKHCLTDATKPLVDIQIHRSFESETSSSVSLPEEILSPGIYRLQFLVTLPEIRAHPGYFEIPLFQVI